MAHPMLRNPHLEGAPFLFEGGPDGVLLVHGFTATTAEVRPLAHHLHDLGYTVSGPLLPGHFDRPEAVNRFRWQDWIATVTQAYRDLSARCDRVVVGGESTGALLTLLLAARQPEVRAVLSYAPALTLTMRRSDTVKLRLLAPFVTAIPKAGGQPSEADELWQGYMVNPLKGVVELLRLQSVVRPLLPQIRQPILIAQGRLDRTVDAGAPQEIYDRVSSDIKELHWFDRSTHCVALDGERESLFRITDRFIERVLSGGTP